MKCVIPDLVSERSDAESVGNPCLGGGEAKSLARRFRIHTRRNADGERDS